MKLLVKSLLPGPVTKAYAEMRNYFQQRRWATMKTEDVFTDIYVRNKWGGDPGTFNSGIGSTSTEITAPYVTKIREWLMTIGSKSLTIVDIGCGDFQVGSKLSDLCGHYVGVDIVAPLIDYNSRVFASRNVKFVHTDITTDQLPLGDVCFVRQVLQHLSNDQIAIVIPKLNAYRYAVITEHLPSNGYIRAANCDKIHGGDIRLSRGSGVFLEQPPFSISQERITVLLEISCGATALGEDMGVIRTLLLTNQAS